MLQNQVVSVTDLRKKTKECLAGLEKNPKFIFSNNKMIAVMITVEEYETLTQPDLVELPSEEATLELKKLAKKAKATRKSELLEI